MFLRYFALTFKQKNPWRLLTLISGCRRRLTSMLHIKRCHMVSQTQSSKKTPLPGANGTSYASGCRYHPTSKASGIPSISSRSLLSACTPAFWKPAEYPSIRCPWNNTFVPSGKYSQPWGQKTQAQQVGKAQLLVGPSTLHIRQTRPPTNANPPHPRLCPPSPGRRLLRRHRPTASNQRPGLY